MPRGKTPSTTPGTCDTCGRAKVWKSDTRRATGGYWTCTHRDAATPRGPRARVTRQREVVRPSPVIVRTQTVRRGVRPVATLAPYGVPPTHLYFDLKNYPPRG